MSKYRIYELAKEFGTTSKVIIDILARNNIVAKNHMSNVGDDAKTVLDRTFARKTGISEPVETPKQSVQTPSSASHQPPMTSKEAAAARERQVPRSQLQPPFAAKLPSPPPQNPPPIQTGSMQPRPPRPAGTPQLADPHRPQAPVTGDRRPQQAITPRPGQPQQQRPQQAGHQPQSSANRGPGQPQRIQQRSPLPPRPPQNVSSGQSQPRPAAPHGPSASIAQGGQGQIHPRPQGMAPTPPSGHAGARPFSPKNQPPAKNQSVPRPAGKTPLVIPSPPAVLQGTKAGQKPSRSEKGGRRAEPERLEQRLGAEKGQPRRQDNERQHLAGKNLPSARTARHGQSVPAAQEPVKPKVVKLGGPIIVKDLASKLGREVSEVIKRLMSLGVMATINQEIDQDTATVVAEEFGAKVEQLPPEIDPTEIPEIPDSPESLVPRPPVVTVMGHVDHGKTSLLDAIRKTKVTASEAGGITQHIGAYQVVVRNKKIVFLDTPGHEAFTAMRARGAQVTDIAVLVVAADDGVMPQTVEAINHAKAAKVPIIVAINKMDRADANPERVKQQLAEHGLVPEEWGGDTVMVPVSAYQKTGLDDLLEMILLVAEMLELKANPNRTAVGTVIEAQLDKGRGPVATVLVQKGTLRVGDTFVAGAVFGKVRAMINDRGEKIKKAEPCTPVEVLGLTDVPEAGDILVVTDEKSARAIAEKRLAKKRSEELKYTQKVSLEDLFNQIKEGKVKDLNLIVKADVQGSIEALRQSIQGLRNKEVKVNIVHAGVGAINETDVMLAAASNALIIGFNVRPDANARKMADAEKVDIRTYRVIYDAINDVEAAMTGMLAPEFKEVVQGRLEVRKVFNLPKTVVAGSYVLDGKITSTSQVRVIRNGIVVHEGKLDALKRFKDDVKEVSSGYECGVSLDKFRDIKEGDILEAFIMEEETKKGA